MLRLRVKVTDKQLVSSGYEPITVNDSSKAMAAVSQIKPDLILLDLMMPESTGFQLCRMMRKDNELKNIPIVIISALSSDDSRVVAIGAGAQEFLRKPFHVSDTVECVEKVLYSKRLGIYA